MPTVKSHTPGREHYSITYEVVLAESGYRASGAMYRGKSELRRFDVAIGKQSLIKVTMGEGYRQSISFRHEPEAWKPGDKRRKPVLVGS